MIGHVCTFLRGGKKSVLEHPLNAIIDYNKHKATKEYKAWLKKGKDVYNIEEREKAFS